MIARVLAYALKAQEGIAFTKGLFDVDEPEVWVKSLTDEITLWIDLGQPDEARIRRACSRAEQVVVLCYTNQALAVLAERSMRLQCMPGLTATRRVCRSNCSLLPVTA